MTAEEVRVTEAISQAVEAWVTVQQALRAELEQLTAFTGVGSTHGPLSPQAQQAEAALRVSAEQRKAAVGLHEKAADELLQSLEALRRAAGH